ncbi:MAG: glycosyltransferase [Lachnoclostridium sp.]
MDKPLISYVVTTHNIEKYVRESVECAFAQTYSPLEIVLSDDCSTDHTFDIMKKMVEEYTGCHKIVLNRNEQNLGITKHMNKAYLELASGEIIIAAHGDDISKAERTELSYNYLKDHPEVTALSFSIDAIDEDGNFLKQHSAIVNDIHLYDFEKGGNIPAPSRAFYKKVMTIFGPLNEDCPTEDELISFRSLMLGTNAFLPNHMVQYRKHSGSSSNPENFARFPLDKILKQQDDDMCKAIQWGYISEEQRQRKYEILERLMQIRKRYRIYFANRKARDLVNLVLFPKVPLRLKVHYIKEHIEYLNNKRRGKI